MKGEACYIIVLLLFEKLLVEGNTRGDKFGDSPLDYVLCELRVFELVTYGNLVSSPDESWQIGLQRMERESCHRHRSRSCT